MLEFYIKALPVFLNVIMSIYFTFFKGCVKILVKIVDTLILLQKNNTEEFLPWNTSLLPAPKATQPPVWLFVQWWEDGVCTTYPHSALCDSNFILGSGAQKGESTNRPTLKDLQGRHILSIYIKLFYRSALIKIVPFI